MLFFPETSLIFYNKVYCMLVLPNVEFVNEKYQIDLQIEVVKAGYCQLMLCSCSVNILSG